MFIENFKITPIYEQLEHKQTNMFTVQNFYHTQLNKW